MLPIPVAAGCGDDEPSDEDPQTVLQDTLDNEESIASGNLDVSVSVSAEGRRGGSLEAGISGPFQGDPEDPAAVPQLDLDVSANGEIGERLDFDQGVTVTEDNAYVEVQGRAYEVGRGRFSQLRDEIAAQTDSAESTEESSLSFEEFCIRTLEQAGGDASACEIDLATWLTNLTNEGTEEVGGAEAVHISGDADVEQILTDVGELVGAFAGPLLQGLDPSALGTFSELVTEASIDVYSGTDDRLLRRLEADLGLDPSALGLPLPIGAIEASVSIEIADLNEEQAIEAPADARSLDKLPRGGPLDLDELGGEDLEGLDLVPIPGAGGKGGSEGD